MRFRERSAASPAQLETGILPMINVVFLLLIFFMLTGHLSAIDPFEVSPPQTESEGIAESDDMLMLIGPYGRVAVDGDDNIAIAGYNTGTVSFGGSNLVSAGASDIFVASFDDEGNLLGLHAHWDINIGAYLQGRSLGGLGNLGGISGPYRIGPTAADT